MQATSLNSDLTTSYLNLYKHHYPCSIPGIGQVRISCDSPFLFTCFKEDSLGKPPMDSYDLAIAYSTKGLSKRQQKDRIRNHLAAHESNRVSQMLALAQQPSQAIPRPQREVPNPHRLRHKSQPRRHAPRAQHLTVLAQALALQLWIEPHNKPVRTS